MPAFVEQYNLGICADLGFIVRHYCEIIATAAGNKVSKYLEVA